MRVLAANGTNTPVAPGEGGLQSPWGCGVAQRGSKGVRARAAQGPWEPAVPGQPGVRLQMTGDSCAWDRTTQP